jgi:hypothetical protein
LQNRRRVPHPTEATLYPRSVGSCATVWLAVAKDIALDRSSSVNSGRLGFGTDSDRGLAAGALCGWAVGSGVGEITMALVAMSMATKPSKPSSTARPINNPFFISASSWGDGYASSE